MGKTRDEIIAKLDKERAQLRERFDGLSAEQLNTACTDSEHPGGDPWTPKDHIAHLAMIERAFQGMIHRTLQGSERPIDFGGEAKNMDEVLALVHKGNQENVDAHKADDLDALFADLDEARIETKRLLTDLTDEQLATKVPGAPWGDGTIGGVLVTNAYHAVMHWDWITEGMGA